MSSPASLCSSDIRWVASLAGGLGTIRDSARWPSDLPDHQILALADRHRVASAIWHTLQQGPIADIPASVTRELARRHAIAAPQSLQATAQLIQIDRLFRRAGISYLTLKGPPLAQQYYGGVDRRHSKDLDLWVPPDAFSAAVSVLYDDGYRCDIVDAVTREHLKKTAGFSHHLCFEKPGAITVELHRQLASLSHLCELSFADAYASATWVSLAGHQIPMMGASHLMVYLCMHGGKHAWSRLKWLADLPRVLTVTGLQWDDVQALARQAGSERVVMLASQLCAQVFDRPLPWHPLPNTGRHAVPDSVMQGALKCMHSEDETLSTGPVIEALSVWRYKSALSPRVRHKMRSVSIVLRPQERDVHAVPLPAKFHFLYVFLRPLLWGWRRLTGKSGQFSLQSS